MKKIYLTWKQRVRHFKAGIEFLFIFAIWSHDMETDRWGLKKFSLLDRLNCAYSCFDTTIRGYVYELTNEYNLSNSGMKKFK